MLLWALLLGAALPSPAAEPAPCPGLYREAFLRDAGISESSWKKMCAKGGSPKEYYVSKRIVRTEDGRPSALAEWYLGMKGGLSEDDKAEFMALDPKTLSDALRSPYQRARDDLAKGGDGVSAAEACTKKKDLPKKLAAMKKAKMYVVEQEECEWMQQATECSLPAFEAQLDVQVLRVCETGYYYCILGGHADPLAIYAEAYERGVRDRVEIEGTRSFGLGPGVRCK